MTNSEQLFVFQNNNECFYCGLPVVVGTRAQDNSACITRLFPGEPKGPHNKVVSCFSCCSKIKRGVDPRMFTGGKGWDALRKWINMERFRIGLRANDHYRLMKIDNDPIIALAEKMSSFPAEMVMNYKHIVPAENFSQPIEAPVVEDVVLSAAQIEHNRNVAEQARKAKEFLDRKFGHVKGPGQIEPEAHAMPTAGEVPMAADVPTEQLSQDELDDLIEERAQSQLRKDQGLSE